MHLLGTEASISVTHAGANPEDGGSGDGCLLDIPAWNFHWQQFYYYQQATQVKSGDTIHLECTFDNTAAAQPVINGVQSPPATLRWGEKTTDEMCLDYLYFTVTAP